MKKTALIMAVGTGVGENKEKESKKEEFIYEFVEIKNTDNFNECFEKIRNEIEENKISRK